MSWSELERLVDDAESDPAIRRGLLRCRSRREFLLATSRLGYRIQPRDLQIAWALDQGERGPIGQAASR
ncbi:MAG: Nif11-like leader peptide family natural product precursor [Cyanobium sp.]